MPGRIKVIVLLAAVSSASLFCLAERAVAQQTPVDEQDVIPKQWLDQKISAEQAEAKNMVEGVPFGAQNDKWKRLKGSIKAGDELWTFCSPFESFKAHAGRCGLAIVRNAKVVQDLVTIMN